MAHKRHKPEEFVSKLRQVDLPRGQGITVADAIRQIGVTALTYYRWRKTYGDGTALRRQHIDLTQLRDWLRFGGADQREDNLNPAMFQTFLASAETWGDSL